jgi:putative ABC transport system permease protein
VQESGANLSRAYRVNLNVLALVALFTGGFLVFSTQSLEVTRRRASMRCCACWDCGAGGVLRLVLAEAAAVGVGRKHLGIALGYATARARSRSGVPTSARGCFAESSRKPLSVRRKRGLLLAGVLISFGGALLPALDASRVPPAQALKAGDEQRMLAHVVTVVPGSALLVAAVALAQIGPVGEFRSRDMGRSRACSSAGSC